MPEANRLRRSSPHGPARCSHSELLGRHEENGEDITDRKIVLAEVRNARIAELTVYCSGDWNAELRARHAAEAPVIRP